jgi:hypothetical protein
MFSKLGLISIGALIALSASVCLAQQSLDNAAVIKLSASGLSEDLIVQTITASAGHYDISTDALIALKQAGITDKEVGAMLNKNLNPNGPALAKAEDPDDPNSPHSGIFMETKTPDGKVHLQKILRTSLPDTKGPSIGSVLGTFYSFGLHKIKEKLIIPGTKAELQTNNSNPVFWIYTGDISIVNFQLLPLVVKKDSREATTASSNLHTLQAPNESRPHEKLTTAEIKHGVYKVTEAKPLSPGSYAFVQGESWAYYDFDIVTAP